MMGAPDAPGASSVLPVAVVVWLEEKNRTAGGRLSKVVRLLKYLRDYKNIFSVKSFILTTSARKMAVNRRRIQISS
jgi:hypothetical protein